MLRGEMGSARISGARTSLSIVLLALAGVALVLLPVAAASHTPNPTSRHHPRQPPERAGLPRRLGPAARSRTSRTTPPTTSGSDLRVPAGAWEYKAPLNDGWTRTTARTRARRPQHPARPGRGRESSSITTTRATGSRTRRLDHRHRPGSFQSELGCPGDWDPDCLRSWLQDLDGDGIYTFATTAIPAGSYEGKVAINESWDENYGRAAY